MVPTFQMQELQNVNLNVGRCGSGENNAANDLLCPNYNKALMKMFIGKLFLQRFIMWM